MELGADSRAISGYGLIAIQEKPVYSKVWIRNFKSLENTELDLGTGLNVVVGPNGAGKTSIIEALMLAKQVIRPPTYPAYPFAAWWGYENSVHMRDINRNIEVGVEGLFMGTSFKYSFSINGAGALKFIGEELRVGDDYVARRGRDLEVCGETVENAAPRDDVSVLANLPILSSNDGIVVARSKGGAVEFVKLGNKMDNLGKMHILAAFLLSDVIALRVVPERAAAPTPIAMIGLGFDGYGLAKVLFDLNNAGALGGAIAELLEEYGYSLNFNVSPDGNVTMIFNEERGGVRLPLNPSMVPHGLIKALTIFAALAWRPSLLMVDEVENSLHLKLLERVVDELRNSGAKVIVTTHSPMVVDLVDPEELVLMYRDGFSSTARRVDDPQKVKKWLNERGLTLSEGWLYGEIDKGLPAD